MQVRFAAPDRRLAPFVQLYWGWDAPAGTRLPRAFPTVQTEIVMHRRTRPGVSVAGLRPFRTPRMHVVGPRLSHVDLHCDGALSFFAIRFAAGGLSLLGDIPARELRDELPALADSIPDLYSLLEPALDETDFDRTAEAVNRGLLRALSLASGRTLSLPAAPVHGRENWERLFAVKDLADDLGYSERQLRRLFADEVGLRPVEYLRLLRFERVLTRIARQPGLNLAQLALDEGFSDQSHLNAELKRFSGRTPSFFREHVELHSCFLPDDFPH